MLNKVWFRRLVLMAMDIAFVVFSLFFGFILRYSLEGGMPKEMWANAWTAVPFIVLCYLLVYAVGGIYGILWRLADAEEVLQLLALGVVAFGFTAGLNQLLEWGIPISVIALMGAISTIGSTVARLIWRMVRGGRLKWRQGQKNKAVMVVGAGEAGAYVIFRYLSGNNGHGTNVILVDDDPLKLGRRVHGVLVRGTSKDIEKLAHDFDVKEIIIAIPSLTGDAYTDLITRCNATKTHVRTLADPHKVSDAEPAKTPNQALALRELNISDFLSREPVVLDIDSISGFLKDKVVLVSGGGGSIGSEICRQVMRFEPKQLVIFDFYENNAYELLTELKHRYGQNCCARIAIGSIREKERIAEVFDTYRPQVVFHAAAHKHVSLMEESPAEAVKNNVFGTMNLLDIASAYGAERFVQLSTDKAVNPSCVMGATKRIAEMLNQLYAAQTQMKCMVVRFGNVLGSHGSVIPLFESQIKAGGPVTVTDPEVTRYFMTIAEAAQLVLQAGSLAQTGATYVLEMGVPVKIADMAKKLIQFYGYEPGGDMEIVYTGLREGEKLHEELMTSSERDGLIHTSHKKIMISPPVQIAAETFFEQIEELRIKARYNDGGVSEALMEMVQI